MWFDESREIKLIELGNNGFNKSVRIRLENITRLKQMLIAVTANTGIFVQTRWIIKGDRQWLFITHGIY